MAEDSTEELPSVEELMQRIAENYEALPRQLKNVATYIEQHRASVMVDRTSDIAASCGVHPSAVAILNEAFAPSAEEIAWARRVVAAAPNSDAAFSLDGRMVDRPVVERARRVLRMVG